MSPRQMEHMEQTGRMQRLQSGILKMKPFPSLPKLFYKHFHPSVKAASRGSKNGKMRRGAPRIRFSKPVSINIYFSGRALYTISKYDQI